MAIDIIIILILLVAVIIGWNKGIVTQIAQIAAIIAGIIGARMFGDDVAAFISAPDAPSTFETIGSYIAAFLLSYCLIWLVAVMLKRVIHVTKTGVVNNLLGALFKLAQWALLLSVFINFLILTSGDIDEMHDPQRPWRQYIVDFAPEVLGYISHTVQNNN